MSDLLVFLIGLLLGGCVTVLVLCAIWMDRVHDYECQIIHLKAKVEWLQKREEK